MESPVHWGSEVNEAPCPASVSASGETVPGTDPGVMGRMVSPSASRTRRPRSEPPSESWVRISAMARSLLGVSDNQFRGGSADHGNTIQRSVRLQQKSGFTIVVGLA